MPSLTIDLPELMKEFIETKASERGFSSPAEFVVERVRVYQTRDLIDQKLLASLESNSFEEVSPAFWKRLRARVPGNGGLKNGGRATGPS